MLAKARQEITGPTEAWTVISALLHDKGLITLARSLREISGQYGYGEVRIIVTKRRAVQVKTTRSEDITNDK